MMYNYSLLVSSIILFSNSFLASTSGSNRISTHYYHKDAPFLDANPVMCGFLGSHMDLTRVTAVQDLTSSECGTCLKVTGNGKTVYVMAVDKGGMGLDINMNSFKELFGEDTGRFDASWEATDSGKCAGIITGGNYNIPGIRSTPPSSVKQAQIEVKKPEPVKDDFKPLVPSVKHNGKDITCKGFEQRILDDNTYVQCVHNSPFILYCNKGTKCSKQNETVLCV